MLIISRTILSIWYNIFCSFLFPSFLFFFLFFFVGAVSCWGRGSFTICIKNYNYCHLGRAAMCQRILFLHINTSKLCCQCICQNIQRNSMMNFSQKTPEMQKTPWNALQKPVTIKTQIWYSLFGSRKNIRGEE